MGIHPSIETSDCFSFHVPMKNPEGLFYASHYLDFFYFFAKFYTLNPLFNMCVYVHGVHIQYIFSGRILYMGLRISSIANHILFWVSFLYVGEGEKKKI